MSELAKQDSDQPPLSISGAAERTAADQTSDLIRDIEVDLRDKLPKQEQGKVLRVVREVVERRAAFFSGPQPPPELIAEYERVAPGWGIRILEMGEREQLHRHACDEAALSHNNRELDQNQSWINYLGRGQVFGFASFVVIGSIGVYALTLHMAGVAEICLGTFAIGIVSAFVKGATRKPPAALEEGRETKEVAIAPAKPKSH